MLHARGVIVQEGLEFFFDSALAAQPDVHDAGPTEDPAAEAAKSTQAAMRKQIEDLQRQLAAVRASDVEPRNPGVITISDLAATPRPSVPSKWRSSSLTLPRTRTRTRRPCEVPLYTLLPCLLGFLFSIFRLGRIADPVTRPCRRTRESHPHHTKNQGIHHPQTPHP